MAFTHPNPFKVDDRVVLAPDRPGPIGVQDYGCITAISQNGVKTTVIWDDGEQYPVPYFDLGLVISDQTIESRDVTEWISSHEEA